MPLMAGLRLGPIRTAAIDAALFGERARAKVPVDERILFVDTKTTAVVKAVTLETQGVVRSFSVHPDGKRIVAWVQSSDYDLLMLEGFPRPTVGLERLFRKWVEPGTLTLTP